MRQMIIRFLERDYTVSIPTSRIWFEGREANALILHSPHCRVLISKKIAPEHRFRELIHEMRHVWTHQLGLPSDDEIDARDVSLFVETVLHSLQRAGGIGALIALKPRRLDLDEIGDAMLAVSQLQDTRSLEMLCIGDIVNDGRVTWR